MAKKNNPKYNMAIESRMDPHQAALVPDDDWKTAAIGRWLSAPGRAVAAVPELAGGLDAYKESFGRNAGGLNMSPVENLMRDPRLLPGIAAGASGAGLGSVVASQLGLGALGTALLAGGGGAAANAPLEVAYEEGDMSAAAPAVASQLALGLGLPMAAAGGNTVLKKLGISKAINRYLDDIKLGTKGAYKKALEGEYEYRMTPKLEAGDAVTAIKSLDRPHTITAKRLEVELPELPRKNPLLSNELSPEEAFFVNRYNKANPQKEPFMPNGYLATENTEPFMVRDELLDRASALKADWENELMSRVKPEIDAYYLGTSKEHLTPNALRMMVQTEDGARDAQRYLRRFAGEKPSIGEVFEPKKSTIKDLLGDIDTYESKINEKYLKARPEKYGLYKDKRLAGQQAQSIYKESANSIQRAIDKYESPDIYLNKSLGIMSPAAIDATGVGRNK